MTLQQLLVWSNTIPQLIGAGIMVGDQIAALLKSFHPGMTDADLNAVAALIASKAQNVKAIATKDLG